MVKAISSILFVSSILTSYCLASEDAQNPFDWDLSYQKLFIDNELPRNDTVAKFFRDAADEKSARRLSVKGVVLPEALFSGLDSGDVKRAILIDYQVFWYFGHRMSSLYVHSGDVAFVRSYNTKSQRVNERPVGLEQYDIFFNALLNGSQSTPSNINRFKAPNGYVYSGYIGAVSIYNNGEARQFLLTPEDIALEDLSPGKITELQKIVTRRLIQK